MKKSCKYWLVQMLTDAPKSPSSKRFVGIVASIVLIGMLVYSMFTDKIADNNLVDAVLLLALGGLSLASVDKFIGNRCAKRNNEKRGDDVEDTEEEKSQT